MTVAELRLRLLAKIQDLENRPILWRQVSPEDQHLVKAFEHVLEAASVCTIDWLAEVRAALPD